MKGTAAILLTLAWWGCGAEKEHDQGAFCLQTGQAWCDRADECGTGDDRCLQNWQSACCGNSSSCSEPTIASPQETNECSDALGSLSCNEIRDEVIPAECLDF